MRIAESYSVIVVPKGGSRVRRFFVSKERILATLSVALGLVLFTATISLGLVHYRKEFLATEDFRNRGRQYEKERLRVLARLGELEDVVNQNEELAVKLETIVGVNTGTSKGVQVGVGGDVKELPRQNLKLASLYPNTFRNSPDVFDETALKTFDLKTIDLTEEAKDVGKRLKEVYHFNPDAPYFWTSIPTVWPLRGWVTSDFGLRRSPLSGGRQLHEGVDIASPYGTPVTATGDGVVTFAGRQGGLGNKIIVDHGYGLATVYGHNSEILVKEGDKVQRGTILAKVGSTGRSTGPHVHYEVLVNGVPVDPLRFILEQL